MSATPPPLDRQALRACQLRYQGRKAIVLAAHWADLPCGCPGIAWPLGDEGWAFQPLEPVGEALAYRLARGDLRWVGRGR